MDSIQISQVKIGIYGWRKRCIYAFVLILLIMVILNLALSFWILKVLELSLTGMGALQVLSNGLRLEGNSFVMGKLITSHIQSRNKHALVVKTDSHHIFSVRDEAVIVEHAMLLGNSTFECLAKTFKVKNRNGHTVFASNGKRILINSECLRITGNEGVVFKDSIQVPIINGDGNGDLKLASATRTLQISASKAVHVESNTGSSKIVAGENVRLESVQGSIKLQAANIRLPQLPIPKSSRSSNDKFKIFQLCVCSNGKLYLAAPESTCFTREWRINCR